MLENKKYLNMEKMANFLYALHLQEVISVVERQKRIYKSN